MFSSGLKQDLVLNRTSFLCTLVESKVLGNGKSRRKTSWLHFFRYQSIFTGSYHQDKSNWKIMCFVTVHAGLLLSLFLPSPLLKFFSLFYTSPRKLSIEGLAYMEENMSQKVDIGSMGVRCHSVWSESLWDTATEWSTAGSIICSTVLHSVAPFRCCRPGILLQSEVAASQSGLLCFESFCCTTSGLSHPVSFHYTSPSGFFYEKVFEVHLIRRWQWTKTSISVVTSTKI